MDGDQQDEIVGCASKSVYSILISFAVRFRRLFNAKVVSSTPILNGFITSIRVVGAATEERGGAIDFSYRQVASFAVADDPFLLGRQVSNKEDPESLLEKVLVHASNAVEGTNWDFSCMLLLSPNKKMNIEISESGWIISCPRGQLFESPALLRSKEAHKEGLGIIARFLVQKGDSIHYSSVFPMTRFSSVVRFEKDGRQQVLLDKAVHAPSTDYRMFRTVYSSIKMNVEICPGMFQNPGGFRVREGEESPL